MAFGILFGVVSVGAVKLLFRGGNGKVESKLGLGCGVCGCCFGFWFGEA